MNQEGGLDGRDHLHRTRRRFACRVEASRESAAMAERYWGGLGAYSYSIFDLISPDSGKSTSRERERSEGKKNIICLKCIRQDVASRQDRALFDFDVEFHVDFVSLLVLLFFSLYFFSLCKFHRHWHTYHTRTVT